MQILQIKYVEGVVANHVFKLNSNRFHVVFSSLYIIQQENEPNCSENTQLDPNLNLGSTFY